MNLVGNALKFTSKGHVLIKVNGKREANIVNLDISITDTGIGIPKDKIETIFGDWARTIHFSWLG